jgi:hypothetical protein
VSLEQGRTGGKGQRTFQRVEFPSMLIWYTGCDDILAGDHSGLDGLARRCRHRWRRQPDQAIPRQPGDDFVAAGIGPGDARIRRRVWCVDIELRALTSTPATRVSARGGFGGNFTLAGFGGFGNLDGPRIFSGSTHNSVMMASRSG